MALTNKLIAIADAIRAKSGKSDSMTLDQMPLEIAALKSEEQLPAIDLPDYVRTEAAEVAAKVRAVLKDDSIVSIKISDSHYVGDTATTSDNIQNDKGNLHACMAVKALTYLLPVDYIAHLGDVGKGTVTENNTVQKKEISDYLKYFREAVGNIPVFVAIGNHDTAIYYHNKQTDGGVHTLPGDWLYDNFTALSESDDTVISGESVGGYCYRDFEDKKLRVFMLNTSENLIANQYDNGTSETQQLWVARALQNLNTKTDASVWGFVVLAHYALDYGDVWRISRVFKSYVNGESITLNGTTVNFSGSNKARFYAQFHGHFHCFKTDILCCPTTNDPNTMQPYGIWRLCTPNAGYNAENNYNDKTFYGINFGEESDYPKTPNTANDTSFVVDVINPSEQKLYSFCYGAGYDRTLSLEGITYYSISKTLTLASVTNESSAIVEEGESYSCKIVVNDGCDIESVVITMGGTDITSTAYNSSTGMVNISSVTGFVVITVVAKAPPVNYVTLATAADKTTPFGEDYNGDGVADGYQKGMMLGSAAEYTDANRANGVATGWIALTPNDKTITIKNISTTQVYYTDGRIVGFSRTELGSAIEVIKFTASQAPNGEDIVITPDMWSKSGINYIRVSGKWTGSAPEIYAE
jgi:hypothetical protein